jgi:hypothetical protein
MRAGSAGAMSRVLVGRRATQRSGTRRAQVRRTWHACGTRENDTSGVHGGVPPPTPPRVSYTQRPVQRFAPQRVDLVGKRSTAESRCRCYCAHLQLGRRGRQRFPPFAKGFLHSEALILIKLLSRCALTTCTLEDAVYASGRVEGPHVTRRQKPLAVHLQSARNGSSPQAPIPLLLREDEGGLKPTSTVAAPLWPHDGAAP